MGEEPEPLGERELCRGRRVSLRSVSFRYGSSTFEADRVSFGSSVVILPVLDDGRVVLVRQWRPAVGSWVLEAPAGRVEPGEEPAQAAERELEEETGYAASRLEELYSSYVSPGYSDEVQYAYLATGLRRVGAKPEEDEVIRVVEVDPLEYLSQASVGVADLKTVTLVALYLLSKERGIKAPAEGHG
jgi:ADP-ribose pyrophosphatase